MAAPAKYRVVLPGIPGTLVITVLITGIALDTCVLFCTQAPNARMAGGIMSPAALLRSQSTSLAIGIPLAVRA